MKAIKDKYGHFTSSNRNRLGSTHTKQTKLAMSLARQKWHSLHTHPLQDKQHSPETKLKMSRAQQGNKNAHWKGGITVIIQRIRRTYALKQWRNAVLARDNHTCQDCRATTNLHAHHIKPVSTSPELAYDVSNGLTLCKPCHRRLHSTSN